MVSRLGMSGRKDSSASEKERSRDGSLTPSRLFLSLGLLDRFLAPLVLIFMIVGCAVGATTGSAIPDAFDQVKLKGVSFPIVIGLLVMMWPVLTKVKYEKMPEIFSSRKIWYHLTISLFLNWIIGPFLMLGLAWATLPDQPGYRTGVIMVGIARCIAMVMIWNQLACGDTEMCAIIVVFNSLLQIALYAPVAILFINVIGDGDRLTINYSDAALSVVIYLGIPLVAGAATRYLVWGLASKEFLEKRFLPYFGPLALVGLLYTIFVLFAYQGDRIVHNLGPVFRTIVPLLLYFVIMWSAAFSFIYFLSRWRHEDFNYDNAVVQSFTAGSNNFELAIAVAIAIYGVDSEQALAATIGPLVEVPALLSLTYLALWLRDRLSWSSSSKQDLPLGENSSVTQADTKHEAWKTSAC